MKLSPDKLLRLLAHFYTNAGKQLCLGLIEAGYLNEKTILMYPPNSNDKTEPTGDVYAKGKEAQELATEWGFGIIPKDRCGFIGRTAREEAKPVLLSRDISLMWGLYCEDHKQVIV